MPTVLDQTRLVAVVNNSVVSTVPDSIKFTEGFAERTIRTQSAGAGEVTRVASENLNTSKSMVSFDMLNTVENIEAIRAWQNLFDTNEIRLSAPGFTRTFRNAIVINQPEVLVSFDGVITVEFESDAAV